MSQGRNVTAAFALGTPLTLTITGSGQVSLNPQGASGSCPNPAGTGTCTAIYTTPGQQVTLTAQGQADNVFAGWTGACTGFDATCTLNMDQARSVNAAFQAGHTLALTLYGHGQVSISPPTEGGAGADCGNPTVFSCTAFYANSSQQVVLTPTAPSGFTFERWTGGCAPGTGNQCVVTMNQNRIAEATFTVTGGGGNAISINLFGSGSVTLSPAPNAHAAATCTNNPTTTSCVAIYSSAQTVTLTAAASGNGTFQGWKGACAGTGVCQLNTGGPHNLRAIFSP
jgi:hypothetical protein